MKPSPSEELIEYLRSFVTTERWERLNGVLSQRTRYLCVVLEDIYQPHNASAVLRSCDCFGIQEVHIVESENRFDPSSEVAVGADQWLTLRRYRGGAYRDRGSGDGNPTLQCYRRLKEEGYRIIATTPHEREGRATVEIDRLEMDKPIALVFGSELPGLSETALEEADGYARIPMFGFSESYNISVSAALCLYELSVRLRRTKDEAEWGLPPDRRQKLLLEWLRLSIRAGDELIEKFFSEGGESPEG